MEREERAKRDRGVIRVLLLTLFLNLLVALLKGVYGFLTGSLSMLADGFHSLLDASSNVVGLVGVYIASRPPDRNHSYGHSKFETLAALTIAVLLVVASVEIVQMALERFAHPVQVRITVWSFAIMLLTMGINIGVSTYEAAASKRLKSDLLHADSRHTLSDVFVSLSVLVGLAATKMGYPIMDTVFALGIAAFITHTAIRIVMVCSDTLCDAERLESEEVRTTTLSVDGVMGCHNIRSRGREDEVYLDLHITVDECMSVGDAHDIADCVEERLKERFPSLTDVVVHVEPEGTLERLKKD